MKKRVFAAVIFLFSIFDFFANDQKIWHVDSEVYKFMNYLYVSQGHAMPNSAGPWSTDELKRMLYNLPCEYEDENVQVLYDKIDSILNEPAGFSTSDGLDFTVHGIINPEVYVHTNKEDFTEEDDWFYDFEKRQKLLNAEAQLWISNNFYGYLDVDFGYSSYAFDGIPSPLYQNTVVCNVPMITGQSFSYVSSNFPTRSFISAGGEHWNFSAGRDILRWGNGETGNLFLGGTQIYDNNMRFSFFYNSFKFSFASIFYPHPGTVENSDNQDSTVDGVALFLAHRTDFRFFKDKINLGLSEAIMFQSASNTLDFRVFNPMVIYHSLYIRGNANSMFSADLNYSVIPGLNFYGQILVDDLDVGETNHKSDENTKWRPNKMGYMLGSKYMLPLEIGVLKLSLEGVYTDPCLYLREKYNAKTQQYGVSFYGTLREFQNAGSSVGGNSVSYLRNCVGYVYGGDSIVGDLKISLDSLENWRMGFEFFYMAHGIMYNDLDEDWITGKGASSPSAYDQTGTSNKSGVPEHFFRISAAGDYDILKWLNVDCGIDNWLILNKNNQPNPIVYDLQLHAGVKIKK